jgi:cytidine deaminase
VSPSPAAERLSPEAARALLERAREVRERAYAPYSGFHVGAALLAEDGRVFTGCNVENASYGLTTCAERAAIAKAVSEGVRRFVAVAVAGPDTAERCPPCGSCRQILHEFGPEMQVVVEDPHADEPRQLPIGELLPGAFAPSHLSGGRAG